MRDREDKTVTTQRDADRRIGERMHDINYWRNEIQVGVGVGVGAGFLPG
jgi:hypothetical protein